MSITPEVEELTAFIDYIDPLHSMCTAVLAEQILAYGWSKPAPAVIVAGDHGGRGGSDVW